MAIYITGDTHGDFRRFRPDIFPEQNSMTKEDLALICGDFGGIWFGDERDNADLDWLDQLPGGRMERRKDPADSAQPYPPDAGPGL